MTATKILCKTRAGRDLPVHKYSFMPAIQTTVTKPQTGKLILLIPGNEPRILEFNKPFALLQVLKRQYMQQGYKKERLKITY